MRYVLTLAGAVGAALAFAVVVCMVLFFDRMNPARECQWEPGAVCTCAGIRDGGDYVQACECCAASPCRPQSDLNLDREIQRARKQQKQIHEAGLRTKYDDKE